VATLRCRPIAAILHRFSEFWLESQLCRRRQPKKCATTRDLDVRGFKFIQRGAPAVGEAASVSAFLLNERIRKETGRDHWFRSQERPRLTRGLSISRC